MVTPGGQRGERNNPACTCTRTSEKTGRAEGRVRVGMRSTDWRGYMGYAKECESRLQRTKERRGRRATPARPRVALLMVLVLSA
jgi:hypothetical protein